MRLAAKCEQELIFFLQAALWEKKGHLQLGFMNNVQTVWNEQARLVVLLTLRSFFIPTWYVNNTLRRPSIFHKHASCVLKAKGCISVWDTGNINPQTSQTEHCFWVRSSPLQTQSPSHHHRKCRVNRVNVVSLYVAAVWTVQKQSRIKLQFSPTWGETMEATWNQNKWWTRCLCHFTAPVNPDDS